MKSFASALVVIVPLVGMGVLVGCAEGAEGDPAESFLAATPSEAGQPEQDDSIKMPDPSNPSEEKDAGGGDDGGAGVKDGGGADAGSDSGVKPDAGGGACASPNTCNGATNLGQISGDIGTDSESAQGHTSQWFTVRVTENDNDISAVDLWMTATLTSPPGTNYDLYVYVPAADTRECSAVSYQSTSTSTSDKLTAKFGETGLFANGSLDDRTVTVEVRHVSGPCDPSSKWTLKVEGNK